MMQETRLVDMGYKGQPFTWCNNWDGDRQIKERIDRAIANATRVNKFSSFGDPTQANHWVQPLPNYIET